MFGLGERLPHLFQVSLQRIEVLRLEAPEGREPFIDLHERLGSQSIEALLRFDSRFDEARLAQHSRVVGYRGLRQLELMLDLADGALGR